MPGLIACKVTPGTQCKIALPGCSALEIKNVALAPGGAPTARCTLEMSLATHNFVLASMPPGGRMQATLGHVVTNDPDEKAWLFLEATGPRTFHVLGRLNVDKPSEERKAAAAAKAAWARTRRGSAPVSAIGVGTGGGDSDEDAWPTAVDIAPSRPAAGRQAAAAARGASGGAASASVGGDDEGEEENIEVLLPEGDDAIEFERSADDEQSEADSDDFVQWMMERTAGAQDDAHDGAKAAREPRAVGGKRPPQLASASGKRARAPAAAAPATRPRAGGSGSQAGDAGGSRAQRRAAATKRARREST